MKVLQSVFILGISLAAIPNLVTLSDFSAISDTIVQPCNYSYWKLVSEPNLNFFGSRGTEIKLIDLLTSLSSSERKSNGTFVVNKVLEKQEGILRTQFEAWEELFSESVMAGGNPLPSVHYKRRGACLSNLNSFTTPALICTQHGTCECDPRNYIQRNGTCYSSNTKRVGLPPCPQC